MTDSGKASKTLDSILRQSLARFAALYNVVPSESLPAIWLETLKDLEPDVLTAALRRVEREFVPTHACPFPVPAHIRQYIAVAHNAIAEMDAEREWEKALTVAQDFGCDYSIASAKKIDDPALDAALRAAGGCRWVATCPDDQLPWAKKIFLDVYAKQKALPEMERLCSRKDYPGLGEAITALAVKKSL